MTANDIASYIISKKEVPEFSLKDEWRQIRNALTIHSRGYSPAEIIVNRHPSESPESFKWRLSNYEPITQSGWKRAVSSVSRILNDSGYTFDDIRDELLDYCENKRYGRQTFFSFFQQEVLNVMLEDPNGYIVWFPINDGKDSLELRPIIVESTRAEYDDGETFIFLSTEKTPVVVGKNIVNEGNVYYCIDRKEIWRVYQVGNKYENNYERKSNPYWISNTDKALYLKLGGEYGGQGVYHSYFGAFTSFANEAIRQYSDWQATQASCAYPIREIQALPCKSCNGEGYSLETNESGKRGKQRCTSCSGSGVAGITSPFAVIERPIPAEGSRVLFADSPMLRYITPPTEIIKYSRESWELLLDKAERALNLKFVEEAQSGVAKAYDREELYAMLSAISQNLFHDLMEPSLDLLESVMFVGKTYTKPVINIPNSFQIKTQGELLEELRQVNESAPNVIRQGKLQELTEKMFSANPRYKKMLSVLSMYDPLYLYTLPQKEMASAMGVVNMEQLHRSEFALTAMNNIIETKGVSWFQEASENTVMQALDVWLEQNYGLVRNAELQVMQGMNGMLDLFNNPETPDTNNMPIQTANPNIEDGNV